MRIRLQVTALIAVLGAWLIVAPSAFADDRCPDDVLSSVQQADHISGLTPWFAPGPAGGSLSRSVSTSWSNDISLGGDFGPVHDFISVHFGVSIAHSYSSTTTFTMNIPGGKQGRIVARYHEWTNRVHVIIFSSRGGCISGNTVTLTARKFVRIEGQLQPA